MVDSPWHAFSWLSYRVPTLFCLGTILLSFGDAWTMIVHLRVHDVLPSDT